MIHPDGEADRISVLSSNPIRGSWTIPFIADQVLACPLPPTALPREVATHLLLRARLSGDSRSGGTAVSWLSGLHHGWLTKDTGARAT